MKKERKFGLKEFPRPLNTKNGGRQIRYFHSVVRNNSFSEAAEECHISQSAISQKIQALERELVFYLLERKKRKFTLTPAGEYFYKKVWC